MKGPIAADALLSLALLRRSADRPSKSRRLTSLPERSALDTPVARHGEDDLGLRVVPAGLRMQADRRPPPHGRHRLRLGEHLGVGAYADLEILGPDALGDQRGFYLRGLLGAGPDVAEALADHRADALADRLRARGVAFRPLLDHALQHGAREGDAAGLDRLKIVGRQKVTAGRIGLRGHAVGLQRAQAAEQAPGLPLHEGGRVVPLQHVRHGGRGARGDVVERIAPERHHHRPLAGRPHAADEAAGAAAQACRFHLRSLLALGRCRGPDRPRPRVFPFGTETLLPLYRSRSRPVARPSKPDAL